MTSKPAEPPVSDEPSQTPPAGGDFLSRPEFEPVATGKKTRRVVLLLVPLLVLFLIAGTGYASYRYYLARHTTKAAAVNGPAQAKATDPYAGWKTYTDVGYPLATGITIKYPSDWQVTVGGKNVAWTITNSHAGISVIDIFQDGTQTAQQVWDSCYATDACLGTAGIKIVSGEETTINGLNAYKATMQSNAGSAYHVTVIRGTKPTSDGVPYVIFTTYSTDTASLNTYNAIMASASFGGSSSSTDPYGGWTTYPSDSLGVSFKYPSAWTVNLNTATCTGSAIASISAPDTEVAQAATTLGTTLKTYRLLVWRYGTQSPRCAPDGTNFSGSKSPYLQSSDEIQSGGLKGNWLTFFGSTTGDGQAMPDTGLVTSQQYRGAENAFADSGTITYRGATYQIEINTSSVVSPQYSAAVPLNMAVFKTTQLYKDSLNILNSVN